MCSICGCGEPGRRRVMVALRTPDNPEPDERILQAAEDALAMAESWIGWDSGPSYSLGGAWTPHKIMRRIADHMIDHICQIECMSAGVPPVPDPWHGRAVSMASDWARFDEQDLDEASARIRRLAQVLAMRLCALRGEWDTDRGADWTIRKLGEHVAEATGVYATRMGRLTTRLVP